MMFVRLCLYRSLKMSDPDPLILLGTDLARSSRSLPDLKSVMLDAAGEQQVAYTKPSSLCPAPSETLY
jgi:hypothetical protein